MNVLEVLKGFSATDNTIRNQAEATLKEAEKINLGGYILSLAQVVGNTNISDGDRHYAGVLIHQSLKLSENESVSNGLKQNWAQIDVTVKGQIKQLLSTAISTPDGCKYALLGLSSVGILELSANTWNELFPGLLVCIETCGNDLVVSACFQALGYICDGLETDTLSQGDIDKYLATLFSHMMNVNNSRSRLAATEALHNSIKHIHRNFDFEDQRNAIMEAICTAAAVNDQPEVKKAAFECFVYVAFFYYQHLSKYMDTIYKLTQSAFTSAATGDDPVALMAIEFWSTIAETELNTSDSAEYMKKAYPILVPALFQLAQLTENDMPSDSWDVKAASAVSFNLIAKLVGDEILNVAMPIIVPCFQSQDWKVRDAGLLFFGDLCECVSRTDYVQAAIQSVSGFFLLIRTDPCLLVKETAAWCLNQIFKFHTDKIPGTQWNDIMTELTSHLVAETHISYRACTSLYNIAHHVGENTDQPSPSNMLSPYFTVMIDKLLSVGSTPDHDNNENLIESFEAVNAWIEFTGDDCKQFMEKIFIHILQQITVKLNSTPDQQSVLTVGLMHGTLQVLYQRLPPACLSEEVVRTLTNNAFRILQQPNYGSCSEDVLLSLSSLISAVGLEIQPYLEQLHGIICTNLRQFSDSNILQATISLVSDICSMGEGSSYLLTYADNFANALIICLGNDEVMREIKPLIFSTLGDLVDAIHDEFGKFVNKTLTMCQGAVNITLDDEDDEEYIADLRCGVLDCFVGMFNGLSPATLPQLYAASYENILAPLFLKIATDSSIATGDDLGVVKQACGLIGDISRLFPPSKPQLKANTAVETILSAGTRSDDQTLRKDASWAFNELCKP